jgi:hypothetical protein
VNGGSIKHFDKKYVQLLNQSKQAKTQWLRDKKKSKLHNLNNARHEDGRYFSYKTKEISKSQS